jgi:hypothetical protein
MGFLSSPCAILPNFGVSFSEIGTKRPNLGWNPSVMWCQFLVFDAHMSPKSATNAPWP